MYTVYFNGKEVVYAVGIGQVWALVKFLLGNTSGGQLIALVHAGGKTYTYSHNNKVFKPDDGQGENLQ